MLKKEIANTSDNNRGAKAFEKGCVFEQTLAKTLCGYCDKETGQPLLQSVPQTAGAAHGDDVTFQWRGHRIGLEAKNFGTQEGGQRAFALQNGVLMIPDLPKNKIHRAMLEAHQAGFVPYSGKIPSFKRGDFSAETWLREKEQFKDQYIQCNSESIANYYRMKGSHYIQVEGKGLYHTGTDPCGFGVPFFDCPTRIRIRCKIHHGKVPTSVTAAFNYNKKKLAASPFCLIRGPLPSCLKKSEITVENVQSIQASEFRAESRTESCGNRIKDGNEDGYGGSKVDKSSICSKCSDLEK